jgi:ribosomal protein S18 acetylase RimI-like enzyme
MNQLATISSPIPLPPPRCGEVTVRLATREDLPFCDALQKQFQKGLGYFKTEWFEGYLAMGAILIAEVGGGGSEVGGSNNRPPTTHNPRPTRLGYVISRDRYLKRDELGIIYQLCVAPGEQRKLIGAELIKAVFERSAYGCKLYCLWCAQDLAANHFWESIGFLPIAFRGGSQKKGRVHIFWQKRIREGDVGEKATPWWFPSQTSGGAMAEDRLAFPIPPGTHWSEVTPVILPGEDRGSGVGGRVSGEKQKRLSSSTRNPRRCARVLAGQPDTRNPKPDTRDIAMGGLRAAPVTPAPAPAPAPAAAAAKKQKAPREKRKIDPRFVAAAREFRDRYLEHVNSGRLVLESAGKYALSRTLPAPSARPTALYQLPSAA